MRITDYKFKWHVLLRIRVRLWLVGHGLIWMNGWKKVSHGELSRLWRKITGKKMGFYFARYEYAPEDDPCDCELEILRYAPEEEGEEL